MAMPVWKEIYGTLRREIADSTYRTGDKLPTEKEMSERFGVNRHTVRRALAELTNEGAIYVRRGSGAYVAEGVIDYRLGGSVKFSRNIADLGRAPAHRLIRAEHRTADERIARHLNLRAGEPIVAMETVAEADGLPICFAERWFPGARFANIAQDFKETGSISAALERYGVTDYRRAWTRVSARAPSRVVAGHLRQPEAHPVMRAETLNLDMAGQPIEYALSYWAGGRVQFMVDGE